MSSAPRILLLASSALAALVLGVTPAHADPTCIAAYEQTQTLRKDGKPLAAKAQAAVCAQSSCPGLLTKDCTKWLAELEGIIPTVVLDPRTPAGALRADVRVKLDGVALATTIDGKPLHVEAGSHTFVIEADGAAPAERTVVLREGEKGKKITVTMTPAAEQPRGDSQSRPVPLGVWIFGGAAVVALATSAVFAIDALGKKSDLDQCKPRCAAEDVDAMSARFTMADVALGAGIMAGAAAAYLFFTRPTGEATGTSAHAAPFVAPLPGGGAAGFTARF